LYSTPTDIAGFVRGITDEIVNVGLMLIQETFEEMDQLICDSGKRTMEWTVERHDEKHLLTSLGEVIYRKTLFENKKSGEMCYLLDRIMGIEKNERMSEDAIAALLSEAVESSYRKGGEAASIRDKVSKQTVKTKIHGLKFPEAEAAPEKKTVEYLYIEADEDHISLQFNERKGDLERSESGRKNNSIIEKLVYVHEGVQPEAPKSKRRRLINPHYFVGTPGAENNKLLWNDVKKYIESHYDMDAIKKIYVNSDGGGWIKAGLEQLPGTVHVLDSHHLNKALGHLSCHMKDTADDVKETLQDLIVSGKKKGFLKTVERLKDYFDDGKIPDSFTKNSDYILKNWSAAKCRLCRPEGVVGSSTEGHVYHVLSKRMSTDPIGWSRKGAEKMAELRAYHLNGGDMLELVRMQKMPERKADVAEEKIFSSSEVLRQEKTDTEYWASITMR
jgi:Uncharacterised protein family (UPF0236).